MGSAYFQAIGKSIPALLLTLTKQGFFLIPLILVLPAFMGLQGIWWSFPIADIMAATVTLLYLRREIIKRLNPLLKEAQGTELPEMQAADGILAQVFEKAGASDRYKCSYYPGLHKFDADMQAEAFAWFDRWLKG